MSSFREIHGIKGEGGLTYRVKTCWLPWTFSALLFSSRTLLHTSQWNNPSVISTRETTSNGENCLWQVWQMYPLFSDSFADWVSHFFHQKRASGVYPSQIVSDDGLHLVHFPFDDIDEFFIVEVIIRSGHRPLILFSSFHASCPFHVEERYNKRDRSCCLSRSLFFLHFDKTIFFQFSTYSVNVARRHFKRNHEIFLAHAITPPNVRLRQYTPSVGTFTHCCLAPIDWAHRE